MGKAVGLWTAEGGAEEGCTPAGGTCPGNPGALHWWAGSRVLCAGHAVLVTLCSPGLQPSRLLSMGFSRQGMLEVIAVPSSEGSSRPRVGPLLHLLHLLVDSLLPRHLGSPILAIISPKQTDFGQFMDEEPLRLTEKAFLEEVVPAFVITAVDHSGSWSGRCLFWSLGLNLGWGEPRPRLSFTVSRRYQYRAKNHCSSVLR